MRTPSSRTTLAVVLGVLVLAAGAVVLADGPAQKTITAYFTQTPGLYSGDPVEILGVPVGKIDSISPEPGQVRVVLHYDASIDVPAAAQAAIISPTLVSGRFIQLTPPYTTGAILPADATLPLSRTVVPVEWDATITQLTQLAKELGPDAGQVTGAVGRVLDSAQANLDGEGEQINSTIRNAANAMTTLAAGGQDLFGTVDNLESVVNNLAQNDSAVQAFTQQLSQVSALLADNRAQLATVVRTFDNVAGVIQNFVRTETNPLSTSLTGLTAVTTQLSDNRQALADVLQRAPTSVSNLNNDYDPTGGLMAGAFALTNFSDPATFVCSLIFAAGGHNDNTNKTCEAAIAPFVQVLKMNNVPLLVDPLQTEPAPGNNK
ncbi:MAG TPA: MCE family protein [Pseudonocardiaceae bacterium]|nr:MCE family protein [Pseudonocardiaceae bacterium]